MYKEACKVNADFVWDWWHGCKHDFIVAIKKVGLFPLRLDDDACTKPGPWP